MNGSSPAPAPGADPVAAVRARLLALSDPAYGDFIAPLLPGIRREAIIGVRFPKLRALAKELASDPAIDGFLAALPHLYLEENHLHALIVERERELDSSIEKLDAFLPFVDNWSTCDSIRPAPFARRFADALPHIRRWLGSEHPYTVRFAIGMLMAYGLGESFSPEFNALAAGVRSDEYYVNMMRAWYFATALAKQPEATLPYLDGSKLDPWTHNKAIQKAIESRRIDDGTKAMLRRLRIDPKAGPRQPIDVAAGVIRRGNEVLICRRPAGKARAFEWEFPGGKLEGAESAEEALVRECREELGVAVRPLARLTEVLHAYPDVTVRLIAVEAALDGGEPSALEHSELRFVPPEALASFDLCPADRVIAAAVAEKAGDKRI